MELPWLRVAFWRMPWDVALGREVERGASFGAVTLASCNVALLSSAPTHWTGADVLGVGVDERLSDVDALHVAATAWRVPHLAIVLVRPPDASDDVEARTRATLARAGLKADDLRVVPAGRELVAFLEATAPPARVEDPLRFDVLGSFVETGPRVFAFGYVEGGTARAGQRVFVSSAEVSGASRVESVRIIRDVVDAAPAGAVASVELAGRNPGDIVRGAVITGDAPAPRNDRIELELETAPENMLKPRAARVFVGVDDVRVDVIAHDHDRRRATLRLQRAMVVAAGQRAVLLREDAPIATGTVVSAWVEPVPLGGARK